MKKGVGKKLLRSCDLHCSSRTELNQSSINKERRITTKRSQTEIIRNGGKSNASLYNSTVSSKDINDDSSESETIKTTQQGNKLDLTAALRIRDIDAQMELARGINPELDSEKVCPSVKVLLATKSFYTLLLAA